MNQRLRLSSVCFIVAVLYGLLMPVRAGAVELFRYRVPDKGRRDSGGLLSGDGTRRGFRTRFKHVLETFDPNWMTTYYHLQLGSFEYAEFYEKPLPHWLVCFCRYGHRPDWAPAFRCRVARWQIHSAESVGEPVDS